MKEIRMIILALLAGIFAGLSLFLQKIGLLRLKKWYFIVFSPKWILGIILAGISFFFYILALRSERIIIVQPIVNISIVVITLLEVISLREKIRKYEIFAIILFFIGLIVLQM